MDQVVGYAVREGRSTYRTRGMKEKAALKWMTFCQRKGGGTSAGEREGHGGADGEDEMEVFSGEEEGEGDGEEGEEEGGQ